MNFPPITSGFIGQAGLLLDIIGAFFLSQGFVLKQPEDVVREASSFWNGNPFFLKSAISQRIEARVGFIFLLLGFVGQFLSYTGLFVTGSDSVSGELIVLGVVI